LIDPVAARTALQLILQVCEHKGMGECVALCQLAQEVMRSRMSGAHPKLCTAWRALPVFLYARGKDSSASLIFTAADE
jgi:hypothetical protein